MKSNYYEDKKPIHTLKTKFLKPLEADQIIKFSEASGFENRELDLKKVDQITENILDGNWIETGAMICLDGRGVCTDGYHRLNAIRKSGVGVWVVVKQTSGFNKRHQ